MKLDKTMKINKIIIAETEKIFLDFAKKLGFKDIKTNENIIMSEKSSTSEDNEEENTVLIYSKDILKLIDFIRNKYIVIEKILICNNVKILSNTELKSWDIIIPNTFIWTHPQPFPNKEESNIIFLESTIWKDYDMKNFGLILNWICSDNKNKQGEFEADVFSENIFTYLKAIKSEDLLEKTTVLSEVDEESDFSNLIAIADMMI